MGIALYRKYRPQLFSEVTGQNHVRAALENELAGNAVAHAYLFTGPRGVGKTSFARIFAKALNCLKRKEGESEPCDSCEACMELKEGRSLDVVEIDAASNTGVDNVRENVIERVRFAPSSRKRKVFIIDEVHMLSASAWNALLKTLEEPPAHAVFVLATTEVHKVPATIVSRCQRFDFKRIPPELMAERLKRMAAGEGISVDDEVIEAVAKLGDGCLRDAESMLEQVLSLDEKRISLREAALVLPRSDSELVASFVEALSERRGADAIDTVNRIVEEGIDLQQFTNDAIELLRSWLIASLGGKSKAGIGAKSIDSGRAVRMINSLMLARMELKSAVIPQLPLELVAAEHCGDSGSSRAANGASAPAKQPPPVIARSETAKQSQPEKETDAAPIAPEEEAAPAIAKNPEPLAASNLPSSGHKPGAISQVPLETLALRWDELCAAVQEENPSLPFLLRVARPLRFEDGALVIGVQYKLHADKLNQDKNRDTIVRGLTALYDGANIPVRAELSAPEAAPPGALTDNLLKQFGGSVLE